MFRGDRQKGDAENLIDDERLASARACQKHRSERKRSACTRAALLLVVVVHACASAEAQRRLRVTRRHQKPATHHRAGCGCCPGPGAGA